MQARTNTLLIFVYGAVALLVALLVFLLGSQHQRTEQLIAELNETEKQHSQRKVTPVETEPRRSMRPAFIRLERLLDTRTQMVREHKNKLSEQISGREKLKQKYDKLSTAYDDLRNEHELLLNEVSFYLSAVDVASMDGSRASSEPEEVSPSASEGDVSDEDAEATDPLSSEEAEFAEVEATRLREELVALTASSQRDAVVAGYASQAMVEMGDSAIPILTAILSDNQADARAWAAWVLGEMGSNAAVAAPDLEPLLNDDNEEVVAAAAEALRQIDR